MKQSLIFYVCMFSFLYLSRPVTASNKVSGSVYHQGQPVPNAKIYLRAAVGLTKATKQKTNKQGKFKASLPAQGVYRLTVCPASRRCAFTYLIAKKNQSCQVNIQLPPQLKNTNNKTRFTFQRPWLNKLSRLLRQAVKKNREIYKQAKQHPTKQRRRWILQQKKKVETFLSKHLQQANTRYLRTNIHGLLLLWKVLYPMRNGNKREELLLPHVKKTSPTSPIFELFNPFKLASLIAIRRPEAQQKLQSVAKQHPSHTVRFLLQIAHSHHWNRTHQLYWRAKKKKAKACGRLDRRLLRLYAKKLSQDPRFFQKRATQHYQQAITMKSKIDARTYTYWTSFLKSQLDNSWKPGKRIPDFSLPILGTKRLFTANNFLGKTTLVMFWAVHCGSCVHKIPMIEKINQQYKKKGLNIVSVSWDPSDNIVQQFRKKKYAMPWIHLRLPRKKLAMYQQLFELYSIPRMILVGPNRRLIASHSLLKKVGIEKVLARIFARQRNASRKPSGS